MSPIRNLMKPTVTLFSILIFLSTVTIEVLSGPVSQRDVVRITELTSCEMELREPKAYQAFAADTEKPKNCSVRIFIPKGQVAQIKLVDQEDTCLLANEPAPITIREVSTNRTTEPCRQDGELSFLAEGGSVLIEYFISTSASPFFFSLRFFAVDIECGDKLDFIQFKHPLRLHTRGKEQCYVYLPGSSVISLTGFQHTGEQCDSSVAVGIGDHVSAISKQTPRKCSIDRVFTHELVCGAARISVASKKGVKAILQFSVKIIDGARASSREVFLKKMEYCDN